MKKVIGLGAIAALTSGALAGSTYNGAGFAIPDNDPAGGSSTISIADSFSLTDVNVSIVGTRHDWVGDLTVTLSKAGGPTVTLMQRVGRTSPTTGAGDSSNLLGDYTFDSDSANSILAEALLGLSTYDMRSGTYWTSDMSAATVGTPSGGANNNALAAFNGLNSAGDWTLNIADGLGGDPGSFLSWSLNLVPEPASLSLLALGGLALPRRR